MTKLKLIGLFVAGLLVGVTAVGWRFKQFMAQSMLSDEAKMAFGSAEEANLLALLRLNETNRAIRQLETSIDGTVLALAQNDKLKKPDETTRKSRDRLLVSVKV